MFIAYILYCFYCIKYTRTYVYVIQSTCRKLCSYKNSNGSYYYYYAAEQSKGLKENKEIMQNKKRLKVKTF